MAVELFEELDDLGHPVVYIKDPEKTTSTYSVVKGKNGFSFYEININRGVLPKELSSQFTNHKQAENAVKRYLSKKTKSQAVKRNENTAEREARKKKETS